MIGRPPPQRIRVLHLVLNLHEGGLERVLGNLIRGSDSSRFEHHVLATEFMGRMAHGLEEYAQLSVAPAMSRLSLLRPVALSGRIASIRPDVVHSHSGVWYKGSLAARMARVETVIHTDHGRQSPDPLLHRLLDRAASGRTDVVIAVSAALGDQLRHTVVKHPDRVIVIPNGIDPDRFRGGDGAAMRRALGVGNAPIVGSVGRLDPIKRYDLMLYAFKALLEQWEAEPAPRLVIAGDGPERASLESLVETLGLGESVRLLGWREDVADLYAAFTLFTMSSRSEGTSIGLLEAMGAGLCPVVTSVGGNPQVLGADLAHRLCPTEDATSLRDAWAAALQDPEQRALDGRRARDRVEQEFSIRRMVAAHEGLYSRLVRRTGS